MKEFITAQLATYPARIEILPQVINRLLPQVDRLNVMLNGYSDDDRRKLWDGLFTTIIKFGNHKLQFYQLDNSMIDCAKYYNIENAEPGYIFTVDDDILYPNNYVEKTIAKIEEYKRKYVVSYHGRVWQPRPIRNFYTARKEMYRCIEGFEGDHFVDCCGDGVAAWHTDTLKMRYDYCELPNMSQLWLALKCNEDNIKQIAIGHPPGMFMDLTIDLEDTIWAQEIKNCRLQTNLINERWIER